MHMGYEPGAYLPNVDAVLVVDCDVPWIPSLHELNPDAKVVHIGSDPHFETTPFAAFRVILPFVRVLGRHFRSWKRPCRAGRNPQSRIDARRKKIADIKGDQAAANQARIEKIASGGAAMDNAWVAHCLGHLKEDEDVLVSESQLALGNLSLRNPGVFRYQSGRRTWLGTWCRDRGQARRPRQTCLERGRRWVLYVWKSDARAFRLFRLRSAGIDRHHEQQDVGVGPEGDAGPVPGRRRVQRQPGTADLSRPCAGISQDRRGLRWLRRGG